MENVCSYQKKSYLCIAFETRDFGRLAQLVQSICLTSRGSAVRIRQRPPKKVLQLLQDFFVYDKYCFLLNGVCYLCI